MQGLTCRPGRLLLSFAQAGRQRGGRHGPRGAGRALLLHPVQPVPLPQPPEQVRAGAGAWPPRTHERERDSERKNEETREEEKRTKISRLKRKIKRPACASERNKQQAPALRAPPPVPRQYWTTCTILLSDWGSRTAACSSSLAPLYICC